MSGKNLRLTNRLRVLRAEKDITQDELAKAVGITRQTVIAIEGEDYGPSLLLGMRIARYFGKTVDEVFTLESR